MGHSRSRQGLHSTGSRTTRACGPVGPVATSSVAPKIATVGTPNAEAICIAPESLVRNSSQRGRQVDELRERGLAGDIGDVVAVQQLRDLLAEGSLGARAEQRDGCAASGGQFRRRFGKTLRKPALGSAVSRAGADADDRFFWIADRVCGVIVISPAGSVSISPARRSSSR